jgi:hypothetical protein
MLTLGGFWIARAENSVPDTMPVRDPFWPVGFNQPAKEPAEGTVKPVQGADWDAAQKQLHIGKNTVARPGDGKQEPECYVLINGRIFMRNDVVRLIHNGRQYQWVIRRLTPVQISLVRQSVEPIAPEAEPPPVPAANQ